MQLNIGLDVGSTTVKLLALDSEGECVFSVYRRHKSDVRKAVRAVLNDLMKEVGDQKVKMAVTGSGGMILEELLGIPFVQEVIAETGAIKKYIPDTDVIIELGGEDSKITYLKGNVEQRMNSICAGGTGAFIDQMANLLDTDATGLNELAKGYKKIYPIASRCGVFAKTDIQSLLNDGASKEDIAMSVFQSVVNQTISNLACGRPIEGRITFLGGPLHFLPCLGNRFRESLGEKNNTFHNPENGQLFVALGAALLAEKESDPQKLSDLIARANTDRDMSLIEKKTLEALFNSEEEYRTFKKDHKTANIEYGDLETYEGPLYLGIDAGSTTSKMVLLDKDKRIMFQSYSSNKGKPLEHVISNIKTIYSKMNDGAYIESSGICGYGEDFIKAAINVDIGEVETIAHYTAAKYFDPKVDFILDIGGQDMKAMHIRDGIIDSIQLNESCSSGCGSFLSTFAASVGMDAESFQKKALFAKNPVDLGSRCTVFMNSKVKQAQKEGAELEDIAAGLCYSVIKNAIQKVIKIRDPQKLGENLVVQGGTFYGDAILRAFEKITGRKATRPDIAGIMGAMGMALIAMDRSEGKTGLKNEKELNEFSYSQRSARCGRCSNNCALTVNIFSDGSRYISGNRCERGAGIERKDRDIPNLYKYKYDRLFNYYSYLPKSLAKYPTVGIPRVMNIYENYPFWHSFFYKLGFPVKLSEASSRKIYDKGLASISSETVCYPAKLVHGHIESLVESGVNFIWYPSIFYENKQFDNAKNQVNCPVVIGFPEVIKNNVSSIKEKGVTYYYPFLSFKDKKSLSSRLEDIFSEIKIGGKTYRIDRDKTRAACDYAWNEQKNYHEDVKAEGAIALDWIKKNKKKAIVLAGRPYHIDSEINHGIPELVNAMGLGLISEDALAMNAGDTEEDLRVLDQWVYHARLYRAAQYVSESDDLELIQLNSFGCGLDAVTSDQVQEILESKGKIYTLLKIDEISNLGAAKIRIRSLIQAIEDSKHERLGIKREDSSYAPKKAKFMKSMKKDYTILVPAMAPDHFRIFQSAFSSEGYKVEFLDRVDSEVINAGLKYVNNDSCYPSITVVGQMMEALESGKYDPDRTALLITQTGGACRASNYVGYIRKALRDMGCPQIPVIALSFQGIEMSPGLKLTPSLLNKAAYSIVLGDLIMRMSNRVRPYEKNKGESEQLKEKWIETSRDFIRKPSRARYGKLVRQCVEEFDGIEMEDTVKPRAGIVGEILVKYLPQANNNLQDILEEEGAEVVVPDLTDFILYCLRNSIHKSELLGTSKWTATICKLGIMALESYRKPVRKALRESKNFEEMMKIEDIESYAQEIVSLGHQYGEGWLLTGEMIELIHAGAPNIVCIQPFGCLPNHITGKGVMKAIREKYPESNIIAIDYDPGASEVNQLNRVKLMMTQARENLEGGLNA